MIIYHQASTGRIDVPGEFVRNVTPYDLESYSIGYRVLSIVVL